jgi:ankyrin repeat protein
MSLQAQPDFLAHSFGGRYHGGVRDFSKLILAIAKGDTERVKTLLTTSPGLAREAAANGATRAASREFYFEEIAHYLYEGDTALHLAAAGYRVDIVRELLSRGAEPGAKNRRGASPLHYAADGGPGLPHWNPEAQAAVIGRLLEAGAEPDAEDDDRVTPLHRAARTRCAAAVRTLLAGGADPSKRNKNGSTPADVAARSTGRGGSGSSEAKAQQREILRLLGGDPARPRVQR